MEESITITIPSWLNDGFFKMILSTEESDVDIISSKVEQKSESEMIGHFVTYRVFIELIRQGQKDKKSLIVKATQECSMINLSEKSLIKEINAYTLLFHRMHEILEKLHQQFAPKLYYVQNSAGGVLVYEDLEAACFRHAVPSPGFNMKSCLLVIKKLAHFHASSVVLHQINPNVMSSFRISTYSEDSRERLQKIFPPILKKLAREVETWPDYNEHFAVKLHNLANSAVDKICECVKSRETDFNVLCHEDLCLQSIMFGYSQNAVEVDDVRLLDYRSVHWGSPAIDFYRFLHSCAAPEVLEWSQILVEEYYSVLDEDLKCLGYSQLCPSIAHLYSQFEEKFMFGLILGLVDRAFLLADDYTSHCVQDTNDFLDIEFSEKYKDVVKKLLFVLQIKGWL